MKLLESGLPFEYITVMIQSEVADRLCAGAGGKDCGAITAVLDYYGTTEKLFKVSAGNFIPAPNHSGGLRYHGMNPIVSKLYHDGYMEARSYTQTRIFGAATQFARCEGTLPAPESSHAIKVAIDEALKCKETGEEKTILFGLTGTGYFDMMAYEKFHDGKMVDYVPTEEELAKGFSYLPKMD
jgi:tryptophan synthase beta chain